MPKSSKIEDAFLMSLGVAAMARERMNDFVKFLLKEGKLATKDQKKLQKKLKSKGDKEYKAMSRLYQKSFETVLKAMNLPTRREFQELKRKVAKRGR